MRLGARRRAERALSHVGGLGALVLAAACLPGEAIPPDVDAQVVRVEEALAPRSTGFGARRAELILPGEFEPVRDLLVVWCAWLADFDADLLAAATGHARLHLLVDPSQPEGEVRRELARRGLDPATVNLVRTPVEGMWLRDFGPITLREAATGAAHAVALDPVEYPSEGETARAIAGALWPDRDVEEAGLGLEGGNVLSDGRGLCLTTEAATGRDASERDETSLAERMADELGCERLVVVPPLLGERTGHVDMLATLTAPGEAIVGAFDPGVDAENAARLDAAARALRRAGVRVRRAPMPGHEDGVFRSYVNAIAVNEVVLVPVYPEDRAGEAAALAAFREAYPRRAIVPIDASRVIQRGGAVHCATMTATGDPAL